MFCFIIFKLIKTFKFVNTQLKKLMFYDCFNSAIIVNDFSKNLSATMMKYKKQIDKNKISKKLMLTLTSTSLFKVSMKMKKDCILQLCK